MVSTFLWLGLMIVLLIIKYGFILPLRDKAVYSVYEARDNVTMSAMKKEISQESLGYQFVINYINFWIFYTDNDYDFSIFLKNLLSDRKIDKKTKRLIESQINSSKVLTESLKIADHHFIRVMRVKSVVFAKICVPIALIVLYLMLTCVLGITRVFNVGYSCLKRIDIWISDSKRVRSACEDYSNGSVYKYF